MIPENKKSSRRRFVYWSMGILSALSFWKISATTASRKKTTKMLTEDGRLVEVDESVLTGKRTKISTEEIQNWVKRNK